MNLFLTGFMGTGKTTVGRRVAEKLKAPFMDMDATIERTAGQSIASIFADLGESVFRRMETEFIMELSSVDKVVVSTGGGAIVNPANREKLQRYGTLICLTAEKETLLKRLKGHGLRPLLEGEPLPERLERLMKERAAAYAACPIHISTDHKSVNAVADEVVRCVAEKWA